MTTPRLRNVTFRVTPVLYRRIRDEADRHAERLGLGGAELRGRQYFLNRVLREFLEAPEAERDKRIDRAIAIEKGEAGMTSVATGSTAPAERFGVALGAGRVEAALTDGNTQRDHPSPKKGARPKR